MNRAICAPVKTASDARHTLGDAGVDRADAAMRDVAPLERHMLHARDLHVVHVRAAPLNEARILAALDTLAHELRKHGRGGHGYLASSRAPIVRAARWMALTMCWY